VSAAVFLTGGTGFLGRRLALALHARGRRLHVLARGTSDRSVLGELDVDWHLGDLTDAVAVTHALDAARAKESDRLLDIVHCGALISYRTRDRDRQRAINVEGTRNVVEAAKSGGVGRFLQISSVVAVGHSTDGEDLSEESAYNGEELGVDYVATKRAAEELVLAATDVLDVVAVNPGAIFGAPSSDSNSTLFLKRVCRGALPYTPPGTWGVVGVKDVVEGCLLALERGRRGRRYLLTESNLTILELARLIARLRGVAPPRGAIPAPIWRSLRAVLALVDRLHPLQRLTPQSARMVSSHFRYDAARAREELGWRPRGVEEMLREALIAVGELERSTETHSASS